MLLIQRNLNGNHRRDELPYLPKHQLFVGFGVESERLALDFSANYVSRMRTRAGQGPLPDARATNAHFVLNLAGEYELPLGMRVFANVQNLTDLSYVVARRPAGARPGLPRTVMVGVRFDLSFGE